MKKPASVAVIALPERRCLPFLLALLPHTAASLSPPPVLGALGRLDSGAALVLGPERRRLALRLALLPQVPAFACPEPPPVAVLLDASAASAATTARRAPALEGGPEVPVQDSCELQGVFMKKKHTLQIY